MDLATGAIGSILSKLADLLKAEYNLQTGVKGQIESLTKELESALTFLQEIDKVPPDQLDEQVKIYASEVREASYDMEDVLDTFLVSVQGPEPIKKKRKTELFKWMANFFHKTSARHDIARAIDDIKKRLQEATERRGRYTIDNMVSRPSPSSAIDPRLAAMYKQVTQLIGIDKSRDELTSLLSMSSQENEMPDEKLKIVSVVGVGGLGKTTLAKAVYENHKEKFSCWAFVPVGRNPDLKKVFRDILIELDRAKYMDPKFTTLDERQLIDELRDFLQRKRYFIVIDDVWDTKHWQTINLALVENNERSRIIITTRKSEVASGVVYKLQPLSYDYSRELLYTRIFGGEDKWDNQQRKVSNAADKILKKCGGVPLAIITMASYLVGKQIEEWLDVCNSVGFCGKDKDQTSDIEWILSLSYYDLPSHLKTCLLYLSIFPEDHLIDKDVLIWLWVAEGFVNNGKEGTGLFEIGEGYFNELINRSLIQPVEDHLGLNVRRCRVHDMILDLICSLSSEANFVTVLDDGEGTLRGRNARRLSLQDRVVEDTYKENCIDTKRARSFIAFGGKFDQLRSFTLLRVLHLENTEPVHLDEHVGDLHHLRCLVMHMHLGYHIELPKEIGALKFLRVLYLGDWVQGVLPASVGMLTQLVCLRAPCMSLPGETIKDLTSLQELRIYYIGEEKDLCNLCELRVLEVRDIGMQSNFLTSVGNLHKLQHLDLIHKELFKLPPCIDPSLLPNLSRLSLRVKTMSDHDLEILGGLPELYYLSLSTCGRATITAGTTSRGYFQKLRACRLNLSTVQFVVNEEDSSVSFTIWNETDDAPAFGSKRKQDSCCRVPRAVMPNLEALYFRVSVEELTACSDGSCDNLGLEYLASLQKVTVDLLSLDVDDDVVEKGMAALRHAIHDHPNRPTLQIQYYSVNHLLQVSRRSGDDGVAKGGGHDTEREDRFRIVSI